MTTKYITNVSFSEKSNEKSLGAHLAYTFEEQGGAASGYNKPLMFKSQDGAEITVEKIEALEKLGEDVTELKKAFASNVSSLVSEAVRKKYEKDWDWVWVYDVDVDAGIAIISGNDGLYSVSVAVDGVNVTVGDVATPVVGVVDYQVVDGKLWLSEDFEDRLEDQAERGLIKSALKDEKIIESLIKAKAALVSNNSVIAEETPAEGNEIASANTQEIQKGETPLELNIQDLLKSAEAQDMIKALIGEATAELTTKLEKSERAAEELRKAEEARIEEEYTTVIKSYEFVEEDKVEALVKHLTENKDVAETIVKAFEKAQSVVKATKEEFGKEVGVEVNSQEPLVKSSSELIKAKAAALKAAAQK